MCIHPDLTSQLAREHHRQTLAAASRRQLRRAQGRQATGTANGVGTIIRRAAAVIAGTGLAAARSGTTGHKVAASGSEANGRLTRQRQCPDGRRTSHGAAYVARGRERDAR
jgi:hypothetical protein